MSIIEAADGTEVLSEIKPAKWLGGTLPRFCRDELLHEIFEKQAARTPGNVAVVHGIRTLSYRELNGRANKLAHLLRSHGIGRGSFVGIIVRRSIEAYVAILGCLKSAAAYDPLDPDYPADRVAFILND